MGKLPGFLNVKLLNVTRYYKDIHETLPLLPYSKNKLNARLANCPPVLRDAFLDTLYTTVRSFQSSNIHPRHDSSNVLAALMAQFDNSATQ